MKTWPEAEKKDIRHTCIRHSCGVGEAGGVRGEDEKRDLRHTCRKQYRMKLPYMLGREGGEVCVYVSVCVRERKSKCEK